MTEREDANAPSQNAYLTEGVGLADILDSVYDSLSRVEQENKPNCSHISTGYLEIDNLTQGLRPGELTILGSRPGVGKSTFALNLVLNVSMQNIPVLLFNLESNAVNIGTKFLSMQSGIPLTRLRDANIQRNEWTAILNAIESISKLMITVDSNPTINALEIREQTSQWISNVGSGVIIIDNIQLVSPIRMPGSGGRPSEVGNIIREIKAMSLSLNVPVIALSQLNTSSAKKQDSGPRITDIRDSAAIEQVADTVLLLDRKDQQNVENEKGPVEVIVAKNRFGRCGSATLSFVPPIGRFIEP